MKNKVGLCVQDRIFYMVVNVIMFILLLVVALPLINIISCSFSSGAAVSSGKVWLWPVDFSVEGYKAVFSNNQIVTGYANTILYTVAGTAVNIVMTMLAAYPLSRKDFGMKNSLMGIFTFTMLFSGGMIPSYILMMNLGLINSRLVMIIPGAISVYNMIIMRTYFSSNIPTELLEAARLDGCSDFRFFIQIVIPLSKAIIAVMILFYSVGHWNKYFEAFLYLNDQKKFPLTIIVRDILLMMNVDGNTMTADDGMSQRQNLVDLLKYALIISTSLPVWCIYPFIQKYFVKGVMIGSIKG